eukprot:3399518-Alexandrium_andersonii.AAC.1
MVEEVAWVGSVGDLAWDRLSARLTGMSKTELRSDCLAAGHSVAAFVHWRALAPAAGYPWCLTRGNLDANLDALAAAGPVAEDVASKIQQLMSFGYPRAKLKA